MAQDNLKILVGAVAGAMLLLVVLVLGKICSYMCYLERKMNCFKTQMAFFYFFLMHSSRCHLVSYHSCFNSTYQVVPSIL
jgi:hypothetical protein